MSHEHHAAVIPGNAVATVGDLADQTFELPADQGRVRIVAGVTVLVAHVPHRTEPTPVLSKRSCTPGFEPSCRGTLVTIMAG
jgi:hypothetical protein